MYFFSHDKWEILKPVKQRSCNAPRLFGTASLELNLHQVYQAVCRQDKVTIQDSKIGRERSKGSVGLGTLGV